MSLRFLEGSLGTRETAQSSQSRQVFLGKVYLLVPPCGNHHSGQGAFAWTSGPFLKPPGDQETGVGEEVPDLTQRMPRGMESMALKVSDPGFVA